MKKMRKQRQIVDTFSIREYEMIPKERRLIMENAEPMVLNVQELQVALGIGRDSAYALMRSRAFPSMKLGGRYIVAKDALKVWMKRNEGKEIHL